MSVENILKANIHAHANGMATKQDTRHLAGKYGFELPTPHIAEDGSAIIGPEYSSFHRAYGARVRFIQEPDDLRRVVYGGLLLDAQEGCIYSQVFSAGQNNYRFGENELYPIFEANFLAIKTAIDDARRDSGIEAFVSLAIKRRSVKPFISEWQKAAGITELPKELGGLEQAHALLDAFEIFKTKMGKDADFVTGFNMDGNETFVGSGEYKSVYARAADLGLAGSCHTGEVCGPEDTWQAINLPGIRSVSHVLSARKDQALMQAMMDKKILVEQLPTINELLTPGLVGTPTNHPLPEYHQFGLRLALGSDVPGITGGHIGKEYEKAAEYGLEPQYLLQMTFNACACGFAPSEVKPKLIRQVYENARENGLLMPLQSPLTPSPKSRLTPG